MLDVLWFYSQFVLEDLSILAEHVLALKLAVILLDYFRSGDAILEVLDDVRSVQHQHASLFLELYPRLAKKKLHLQRHIPDSFAALNANVSCWTGERNLRRPKLVGSRCFKTFHVTLLNDAVQRCMAAMKSPSSFECDHLGGTPKPIPPECVLKAFGPSVSTAVSSKTAVNRYGRIYAKDIVAWSCDGRTQVATVACFEEARLYSGARVQQAVVYIHTKCGPITWLEEDNGPSIRIDLKGLRAVPYMKIRNTIHVRLPSFPRLH